MSEKNSIAAKKRWAKIPKDERSDVMARVARKKWAKVTPEQRREHSVKMNLAQNKHAKTT